MVECIAVVLAGGTGSRMGDGPPKQLRTLGDRTVLEHSIAAFAAHPEITGVLVMTDEASAERVAELVAAGPADRVLAVLPGGPTRFATTRAAVAGLARFSDDAKVLLHDAARPLVPSDLVDACLAGLDDHDGVVPVLHATDTLLAVDAGGVMERSLDRSVVRLAQTPQAFRLGTLRSSHLPAADGAEDDPTDDGTAVLRALPGARIATVPGDRRNRKVTYPEDLELLGRWLAAEATARTAD